jgi:TetR/AcrR family transcriptional regulator, transcriptional repressor for nem operon
MPSRGRRRPRSRDLAKQQTREALLDAGLAQFAAQGLDTPSLDVICADAGFTRGAFYVHFRDREDFVVAVMERVLGAFMDAVIATGDQAHDLERTVTRFADTLEAVTAASSRARRKRPTPLAGGMQLHRLLEACARSPAIRARLVGLVQQALGRLAQATGAGQVAHTVRRDVDPRQVATLLVMLGIGLLAATEIEMPLDSRAGAAAVLALLRAPGARAGRARGRLERRGPGSSAGRG